MRECKGSCNIRNTLYQDALLHVGDETPIAGEMRSPHMTDDDLFWDRAFSVPDAGMLYFLLFELLAQLTFKSRLKTYLFGKAYSAVS